MEVVGYFNESRASYKKGEWDKAVTGFNKVLSLNPNDKLSNTYIERCEHLKGEKLTDWDGVWTMTTK